MNWFQTTVLIFGLLDAGLVSVGGIVTALVILLGWDAKKLWERVLPATATMVGSNIAAAVVLGAVHWVLK